LKEFARKPRFIVGVAALCLLAACTFVSKATIAVSGNCPGCGHVPADDGVALAIAPVLERHGLRPVWSMKTGSGPCTGARGCSWAPEGRGWLQPWVLVASPSGGQVRIRIESRHDAPGRDSRTAVLTEEMARALGAHFGDGNVVIEQAGRK
jgi:hypothetical protein